MKHAQPQGLDRRRVEHLLSKARSNGSAGGRIDTFSRQFIGHPYVNNPLIGSAGTSEVFTVSLNGFDCVTYVETILAMSLAANPDEFVEWLRRIRYEGGCVEWRRRNHYMTQWIRNNVRIRALRHIRTSVPRVSKKRLLNVVPGLPPRRIGFDCVPKPFIARLKPKLSTGDLIFFASTRKHLDVFHCGILVRNGERLVMRHASRSQKSVVEQDLDQFLKSNRMAGIVIARPAPGAP